MKRTEVSTPEEDALWGMLLAHQSEEFSTQKGLTFTYEIRGSEVFFSRKTKSITRATVNVTFHRAKEIEADGVVIDGPKKLGTFGASYLYPVFLKLGVITLPEPEIVQLRLPEEEK